MNTPGTDKGAMLQAAFAQLQFEYRAEQRHQDAHHVHTVASKLTDESAERVLWIMLDIMAGRRDAQGKRTMIEAGVSAVVIPGAQRAIAHQKEEVL